MPKTLQRSFAGGEITPEMFGRLDLPKFQTGAALIQNFIALAPGALARRPGFYFVNEARDSANPVRLIPFVFSATQAIVLEFGNATVRFHDSTGTVLETAKSVTAMTNANPGVFTSAAHGYSNGDGLFLATMAGVPALTSRFVKAAGVTTNTFQLTELDGTPIDTTALGVYTGGGTVARVYTLASPYTGVHLPALDYAQDSDVLTLTHPSVATRELRRLGATTWQFSTVSFNPTLSPPTGVTATATVPVAGGLYDHKYVVTAVAADLVTESIASSSATCSNNLNSSGNYNKVTWSAAAGAARYNVYKYRGGAYGYVGQTVDLELVDDNIRADTTITPPETSISLNSGSGNFPAAVTHYERRRWFAGTTNKPQTIWATKNGTLANLTSSVPARADDGMEFRIAATQQNAIRHLMPLNDLVALTVGGEFRIFADPGPAIAFDTLSIKPQGSFGATDVQPVLAREAVMYVQAQGSHIIELTYDASGTGSLKPSDTSILATHLFDGYTVVELAFQRAPEPVLWALRSDGVLLGMTYVPDQQVFAWHRHTTDGLIKSIAVIPESNRDALYIVAQRTVDGRSVQYIERLNPRFFATQADAFFVDSGLTYSGPAVSTLTGLWHLEGRTVVALADGAVVTGLVVTNGSVTLPDAATKVQIGLNYTSDLQTLPWSLEGAPAGGQGIAKNVKSVAFRVKQSLSVKAGPSFDRLVESPAHPPGTPIAPVPAIADGVIIVNIPPSWADDAVVCLRQDTPLPLTVVSMTPDVAVGG